MSKVKPEIILLTSDDDQADFKKTLRKPRIAPKKRLQDDKKPVSRKRKVKEEPKCEEAAESESSSMEKKKPKTKKSNVEMEDYKSRCFWTEEQLLSEIEQIDQQIARNIIKLFADDNTIPFITRYRKELTGGMSPEKLRDIKKTFDDIKKIKSKASNMLQTLANQGKLDASTRQSILSARTLGELEHIYAPFKVSKHTLAERARQLGLGGVAENVLNGYGLIDLAACMDEKTKGLDTVVDVLHGIQHIIADIVCKDRDLMDQIQRMYSHEILYIESSKSKPKDTASASHSANYNKNKPPKSVDPEKFKLYFDFKSAINYVQSYQVLAINRGEALKILTVKITIPDRVKDNLYKFCEHKWLRKGTSYRMRTKLFQDSFNDAYKRLISPLIVRETRSILNKKAQKASIDVFSNNLKHLLLTQPVKATKILGIDPGFTNGCKMALISERGEVLDTSVIYPHTGKTALAQEILCNMMHKHNCSLIALGNGTACRETENFLSALIDQRKLPFNSKYSIINERGASIYSCCDEATKEFPKLDPNLRSAVYIARCLQDPLCEMVKIDPKHLGVGMYQHDVPEKILSSTLHEVVVECVSFVGVDINTVSCVLLKQVAGLNGIKAEKIIKFRDKFGPFLSRERVKDVPGIGPKSFEQFIGFIRVVGDTSGFEADPLDSTLIHPESYPVAKRIACLSNTVLNNLGTVQFTEKIKKFTAGLDRKKLAFEFEIPEERIDMVLEALCKDPKKDYRCDSKANEPLFKCSVTSMEGLKPGEVVTGVVNNVTQFGAFVDIGVGPNGLIPMSMLKRYPQQVELGNRVEVRVDSVELQRKRITLFLLTIM